MSKINFEWATQGKSSVFLGIGGPSGSGKTKSALRIASGLKSSDGTIYMVDTEKRGNHYAKEYKYKYARLEAPFTYERYLEAIIAAGAKGGDVVIVDSASHAHDGPGGLLEQHEAELQRMAGDNYEKREKVKFAAWIKPKGAFTKFVARLTQLDIHVIFCFRAKDKMEMRQRNGKMEPVSVGWQPICTEGLAYEMTAMLVLPPGSEGVPDLSAQARKMPSYVRAIFKEEQLSEATGTALAYWALNSADPQAKLMPGTEPKGAKPKAAAKSAPKQEPAPEKVAEPQTMAADLDPKIMFANEAVATLHSSVSDFLHWWHGLDDDSKRANLTQASYQRFCVELAKYSDGDTINSWVQTLSEAERSWLAPVRETVRGILRKAKEAANA